MTFKTLLITALIVIFILTIFIIGKIILSIKFSKQVMALFSQSKNISDQRFSKNQLVGLPEPVQRYFNNALKDGQRYVSYARFQHNGLFKMGLNKGWINIKGEQYVTTRTPGFIWKGKTMTFVARDMYIFDQGRLIVFLFSIFNVVDAKGENYDEGELLRWLGESILYPTNLLPCTRLHWSPIDSNSAKLMFNYNNLSLFFKITFNELGEIIEMETKRYMGNEGLKTWIIKPTSYKELNSTIIPTSFDVIWRLKTIDFCYAKFNITRIEYDNPAKF